MLDQLAQGLEVLGFRKLMNAFPDLLEYIFTFSIAQCPSTDMLVPSSELLQTERAVMGFLLKFVEDTNSEGIQFIYMYL